MDKFEADYKCRYCGFEFTAQVGYLSNRPQQIAGGGCSAVICGNCGNGLRPRLDAQNLRELEFKRGVWK